MTNGRRGKLFPPQTLDQGSLGSKRTGSRDRSQTLETDMKKTRKQGIVRDERGQTQPADKQRAQQSQMEGPAAYAPHETETKEYAKRDSEKK